VASKLCPYSSLVGEYTYCTEACPIKQCEILKKALERYKDGIDALRAQLEELEVELCEILKKALERYKDGIDALRAQLEELEVELCEKN